MGPFAAHHLHQFLLSGVCQRDLSVCHGPSSVWLPLWLVLQLLGLQEPPQQQPRQQQPAEHPPAQQPPAQHTNNAGRPAQRPQQGRPSVAAGAAAAAGSTTPPRPAPSRAGSKASATTAAAAAATHKLDDEDEESDDYSYGVSSDWLKKVKAVEAATKARQQQERAAQQQLQQQQQPAASKPSVYESQQQQSQQQALQEDRSADADMQDASAEAMLDAVSQLRGEQEYLDELHKAVAMDWEPTTAAVSGTASQQPQQQVSAAGAGGTCSAVDLAQLGSGVAAAAAAASSSPVTLPQQQQQGDSSVLRLVLVLDTNVLLEKQLLQFLSKLHTLQRAQQHQHQQNGVTGCVRWQLPQAASAAGGQAGAAAAAVGVLLRVVIPWTVLVELDKLKLREGAVGLQAKQAVEALRKQLLQQDGSGSVAGGGAGAPDNMLAAQSLQEFRQAAQDHDFGVLSSAMNADDRILQCAIAEAAALKQQQQEQRMQPSGWSHHGVLLLTNDKVMSLKAHAAGIPVSGLQSMPPLELPSTSPTVAAAATSHPSSGQLLPQLPAALAHMLRVAGIQPPWLQAALYVASSRSSSGSPRSTAGSSASSRHAHTSPLSTAQQAAGEGHSSPKHRAHHRQHHHHGHHNSQQQQQQELDKEELSAAAGSFLTFLRLSLSDQVLRWFQADHEELWLDVVVCKPPWSDVEFIEVLHHHYNSTIRAHFPPAQWRRAAARCRNVVEYLLSIARRLARHNFRGLQHLDKLPSNVAVRVLELLAAFGAQEAAQQVEAALSAAAPGSGALGGAGGGEAGPAPVAAAAAAVPNMHAQVAALTAAAAAGGAATSSSAAAAAGTLPQGAVNLRMSVDNQQQPSASTPTRQQQHPAEAQSGHEQQHTCSSAPTAAADDAAVAALSAAAAAVPAPQPAGPCLTLGQLLQYAVSLLQAVVPLLGQMLPEVLSSSSSAAAGGGGGQGAASGSLLLVATCAAYEQQLRAVGQQLEQLGHQVGQHQQQLVASSAAAQGDILQLGLLTVQLCSSLLNDEGAKAAVSQQLMQHAAEWVAEAAGYLTGASQRHYQQQHQQQPEGYHLAAIPGPALMLQQLTSALHALQHLLSQAMQFRG